MTSKPNPKCPTCKKSVLKQENAFFPFCSERCRLIDLGQWLDGGYSVPGSDSPSAPDDNPENN
jgi:uncharacterized protein